MANLIGIVKIINDTLKAKCFGDIRYSVPAMYGISKSLPFKYDEDPGYLPSEINNIGEVKILAPDDRNVIQVYHKVNSISNQFDKLQFGNDNSKVIRTAQMSMIVFGQRDKIKLSDHDLDFNIMATFPNQLTKQQVNDLQLSDCEVKYGSTDFNSVQLFAREYNTKKYYLKPQHLFFEVKYTIECRLNKACINVCPTC